MARTPAQQRNAVSEGMALGLLICGRDVLPFDKMALDLAFEGAWRTWTYREIFPQVNTDLSKGLDGTWAMTRADASKQTWALYWEQEGNQFKIYARTSDWQVDNSDDLDHIVGLIDDSVPPSGWEGFAREFLSRFERSSGQDSRSDAAEEP